MKYKQLTEENYKEIKYLLALKIKASVVAKITKRSQGTISTVKRSTSFANYHALIKEYIVKRKLQKQLDKADAVARTFGYEANDAPVPSETQDYMVSGRSIVSELYRIAEAMERLATAWETKPKRPFGL